MVILSWSFLFQEFQAFLRHYPIVWTFTYIFPFDFNVLNSHWFQMKMNIALKMLWSCKILSLSTHKSTCLDLLDVLRLWEKDLAFGLQKSSKSYEQCAKCLAPSVRFSGLIIMRTTPTSLTKGTAWDMREMRSIYSIF